MDERLMRGASPAQAELMRRAMAQQQLDQLAQQTTPLYGAMRLGSGEVQARKIGPKEVKEAAAILQKYKSGKANLERRVIEDEEWYKIRHWGVVRDRKRWARACGCSHDEDAHRAPEPSSAWLFNALINKHADAMDNYPEPVVLPREPDDEQSAQTLSEVLPAVLEANDFEHTYSAAWWQKLKHGTAVYGVFWDAEKDNGIGDIAIREVDLLNIFWEPGITDIQQSRNVFVTELVDTDTLDAAYPQYAGRFGGSGGSVDVSQYIYDDSVDTSEKSVVVDWYYRRRQPSGKTVLHYCKFCNGLVLYASENDAEYAARGYYDHGEYPFVFDVLFPEEGTPTGFGYVAVCREPQLYIDRLYANILDYADKATRPRYFISSSTGVSEKEFMDWSNPVVHVEGTLDETRIRQIELAPMSGLYVDIINLKIAELKETSSNNDANTGSAPRGVTAASAISALQEAGNKTSRDMISASYRAMSDMCRIAIDLMRQFYDVSRAFRITGRSGEMRFVQFSGQSIAEQPVGTDAAGEVLYRVPIFDLKVSAQKKNPFSRMEQNERAKELYGIGFFDPQRAQEAQGALDMMDFEGIEDVRKYVQQGQTLMQLVQQQAQLIAQLQAALGLGAQMGAPAQAAPSGTPDAPAAGGVDKSAGNSSPVEMTNQGKRMAATATPHV